MAAHFGVTKGLIEEFGKERVWETPLSETAIIGNAIGAAIYGLRPVAEMQFADFVVCGFNQLVNNAAKLHYRWGPKLPMVVRLPWGGGVSGGPFHSGCMEAWFMNVPGLKLVCPSTARDAKGSSRQRSATTTPCSTSSTNTSTATPSCAKKWVKSSQSKSARRASRARAATFP